MHFTAGACGLLLPRGNELERALRYKVMAHLGKSLVMLLIALIAGLPVLKQDLITTLIDTNTRLRLA